MRRRALAGWLIAVALLMDLLVPAGFMPVASGASIRIELCSGHGPEKTSMKMPGMDPHSSQHHHSGKDPMPCGFSGSAAPSLTIVDPILPVMAIILIVAALFRISTGAAPGTPAFLRPPLRGPPVTS
jgi:hypothetical protein